MRIDAAAQHGELHSGQAFLRQHGRVCWRAARRQPWPGCAAPRLTLPFWRCRRHRGEALGFMAVSLNLIHVGLGLIGGTAIGMLREQRSRWESEYGVSLQFRSFIDSSGGVACDESGGYSDHTIDRLIAAQEDGVKSFDAAPAIGLTPRTSLEALDIALSMGRPAIVIDCATGADTATPSAKAVTKGAGASSRTSRRLALPVEDARSKTLWSQTGFGGRVRYETSCGAGLPVISTLRGLLDSGEKVMAVSGALSGTLGAIFADVASGVPFSQAVRSASDRGYTEPNPRDDLSGLDVARKALILARTAGMTLDLDDVSVAIVSPSRAPGCLRTGVHG